MEEQEREEGEQEVGEKEQEGMETSVSTLGELAMATASTPMPTPDHTYSTTVVPPDPLKSIFILQLLPPQSLQTLSESAMR